jgi:hypothetical protein
VPLLGACLPLALKVTALQSYPFTGATEKRCSMKKEGFELAFSQGGMFFCQKKKLTTMNQFNELFSELLHRQELLFVFFVACRMLKSIKLCF